MPGGQATGEIDEHGDSPGWNNSTTTVQVLRDRMRELGWAVGITLELPICDDACQLEHRPLDLGVGLWR